MPFSPILLGFLASAFLALMAWGLPWIFVDQSGASVASIILLFGGLYFGFLKKTTEATRSVAWRRGLGLIYLMIGFWLPWIEIAEATLPWKAYEDSHLTFAKSKGQPVMIDFTAAWCEPCQVLERQVFMKKRIARAASRFVVLKADMTHSKDPKVRALAERFSIVAFPTVIFIGSHGEEETGLRLVGIEGAERFEKRLRAVK